MAILDDIGGCGFRVALMRVWRVTAPVATPLDAQATYTSIMKVFYYNWHRLLAFSFALQVRRECLSVARALERSYTLIVFVFADPFALQHILKLNPTSMEVRVSACYWRGLRADYVIHRVLFGHSLCCFPCYWPPSVTVLIACCSSFPRAGECHATRADTC